MSTKSTIISTPDFELYEETAEPQYREGVFTGYNVYLIIGDMSFRRVTMEGIQITVESKVKEYLPDMMIFWTGDVLKMEVDVDGLEMVFKGGSNTAKQLVEKDFLFFLVI